MLIIGAKGFAKEVLEVLHQQNVLNHIVFFDNISNDVPEKLYDLYPVLKTENQVEEYFSITDCSFTIGIGNPILRKKLKDKFTNLGGIFTSTISPKTDIGNFGNLIQNGCNIMTGTIITNDVTILEGVLINLNCTIGHDSIIGNFVELSPGVHISGNCKVGDFSVIGTNSTILPKINIGKNVIIGAGSVVTKDIPDNCMAFGVPAKIIKELDPLEF